MRRAGVVVRILLVLRGVHARIVGSENDEASANAGICSREQRVRRDVHADVLHGPKERGHHRQMRRCPPQRQPSRSRTTRHRRHPSSQTPRASQSKVPGYATPTHRRRLPKPLSNRLISATIPWQNPLVALCADASIPPDRRGRTRRSARHRPRGARAPRRCRCSPTRR